MAVFEEIYPRINELPCPNTRMPPPLTLKMPSASFANAISGSKWSLDIAIQIKLFSLLLSFVVCYSNSITWLSFVFSFFIVAYTFQVAIALDFADRRPAAHTSFRAVDLGLHGEILTPQPREFGS